MISKLKRKFLSLKRQNRVENDVLRDYLFRKQVLKIEALDQSLVKAR